MHRAAYFKFEDTGCAALKNTLEGTTIFEFERVSRSCEATERHRHTGQHHHA